jgi:hypothetical protein
MFLRPLVVILVPSLLAVQTVAMVWRDWRLESRTKAALP